MLGVVVVLLLALLHPRIGIAGTAAAVPISEALDCGSEGSAGGLAPGTTMQRHDLELGVFPEALCNDGTPALFYFRPYTDPSDAGRWVIQLQGGGSCDSGQACADRWCSFQTAFGTTQMSSNPAPSAIEGQGILDPRPANPLRSWNHVFVRYCSSDGWSGTAADVELGAEHPLTRAPIDYRIHFLGSRILDAVLDTLRRDGVAPLVYDPEDASIELPDLDEAERVLLAGASAGGSGVVQNLDRVAGSLEQNSACAGPGCPLEVRGLIDSAFGPALETLDFSAVDCGGPSPCTWESYVSALPAPGLWLAREDESCEPWHSTHEAGSEWQCRDASHVVRHHVTTPMFVRMGQNDSLLSAQYAETGLADPQLFVERVRIELDALRDLPVTADEQASIPLAAGAFGPTCAKHETLRHSPSIFRTAIEVDGAWLGMFDVMASWLQGQEPAVVVTPASGQDFCAGESQAWLPALSPVARAALIILLLAGAAGRRAVPCRR